MEFVEKIKIHILCPLTFSRKSRRFWDNVGEIYGRDIQATGGNITRRMRIACWKNRATYTHSEYVILTAFPQQQLFHERSSILCLNVYCLSFLRFVIPVVCRINQNYKVYVYIVKHNYRLGGMLFTTCKAQLYVSATNVGHLQVVQRKLINNLWPKHVVVLYV